MLDGHGFEKVKAGIYKKQEEERVFALVGLNLATKHGGLEINMVVRLRFMDVDETVYDLLNEKEEGLITATIAGNVGYVGDYGKYYVVYFDSDNEIERGVKELETALIKLGFPFFRKNKSMQKLVNLLPTARYVIPEQAAYRLPVALQLLGRKKEAIDYVESKVKDEKSYSDPASERFRKFAKAFYAKYGE
ncbi:hypothetical protein K7I13_11490 [Brucepastera parasyntrophica]|uniref:hypothetical protein n=1 Tax=Brucepastera parasyntrophica TaxID=2880008 RepID=UPI00210B6DE3|nr:hypothetical protein [Brucepastera parasyntrophica]ULQ59121.1 hypothetical protein K7I13_11490 [Brucepastera parasyntrophica]